MLIDSLSVGGHAHVGDLIRTASAGDLTASTLGFINGSRRGLGRCSDVIMRLFTFATTAATMCAQRRLAYLVH